MVCLDPEMSNTLLNAATGTGAGQAFAVPQKRTGGLCSSYGWQTSVTGTFTGLTVVIQGSMDGTNWTTVDTSNAVTGESRFVSNVPMAFLRPNVTTFTGGTNVSVTLQFGA